MSAASLREARKCLYAAAVMADYFGKPKTADKFRAAEVALDDLRLADVGGLEDSGGFTLTADRQASEAAAVHKTEWAETILRLRVGEPAPVGFEIKRVIGTIQQSTSGGANYEDVYVVACREVNT